MVVIICLSSSVPPTDLPLDLATDFGVKGVPGAASRKRGIIDRSINQLIETSVFPFVEGGRVDDTRP